jgi:hypothetical protein
MLLLVSVADAAAVECPVIAVPLSEVVETKLNARLVADNFAVDVAFLADDYGGI